MQAILNRRPLQKSVKWLRLDGLFGRPAMSLFFKNEPINPAATIIKASRACLDYAGASIPERVQSSALNQDEEVMSWKAPALGCFKINCDVAMNKNGQDAMISMVIRNNLGKMVDGAAKSLNVASVFQGELQAIRMACVMSSSLGLANVTIESDNPQAIIPSVSELDPPWDAMALISDVRKFVLDKVVALRWVRRSANRVAHEMAALAMKGMLPPSWIASPPAC